MMIPSARGDTAATYSALRYGGETRARVRDFLRLDGAVAVDLEASFLSHDAPGKNAMRPRFAREDSHLQAVKRECGVFPVMPGAHR